MDQPGRVDDYLSMRFPNRAHWSLQRRVVPAAVLALAVVSGCGGGGGNSSSVSTDVIRSSMSADVQRVLTSNGVTIKGTLSCEGKAPPSGKIAVFDCFGTSSDGKQISATLNASVSGKSCTGPTVVNVGPTQIASLPNEKCG
ncbi:MAG: hypothetical protein M3N98_05780 [Actinomycetota bacterium]|nr:hypothetical protein [Actinomycetota bacterium]